MRMVLVVSFLFLMTSASAQLVEINGKVFNHKGEPLINTSIKTKGKRNASLTDEKGGFRIVVTKGDSLLISQLGYSQFNYGVTKAGTIEVELQPEPLSVYVSETSRVLLSSHTVIAGKLANEVLNDQVFVEKSMDSAGKSETKVFMRVEIYPALNPIISLDTAFSSGIDKKQVKRKGDLEFQFIISQDRKIENIRVVKSYEKTVDQLIIDNFKTAFKCTPALLNGKWENIDCKVSLKVYSKKGKVRVEIIDPRGVVQ